jgi:hypothetical protein
MGEKMHRGGDIIGGGKCTSGGKLMVEAGSERKL